MIEGLNVRIIDGPVDLDVTEHVEGLDFGKVAVGGFGESAQFTLDLPRWTFPTLGEQSRVIVTDDAGKVVWEGFASDPGPVEGEDGEAFEVLAMGAMVLGSDRVEALVYVDSEPGSWVLADGSVETGQLGGIDHGFRLAHPQGQAIDQGYFVGAEWRLLEHAAQDVAQIRFTAKAGVASADYVVAVYAIGSDGVPVLVDAEEATTSAVAHTYTLPAATRVVQVRWVRAGAATNVTDGLAWVDITYPVAIGSRVDVTGAPVAPTASVTSGAVVADLIGRGVLADVDPRAVTIEAGATHTQLAYPTGARGSTILADLRQVDKEFIWGYGARTSDGHAFHWTRWPTTPRYTLSDADEIARTGGDSERCHRVSVYYTDPDTKRVKHVIVVSNLAASVRVRDADPVTLEEATEADALEAGREVLLSLSAKPPSGSATVTRRIFDHLLQTEVEPWEIEPGAVATIESTGEVLRITSTSVDADESGVSCTLSIGDPDQTLEDRMLAVVRGEVDPRQPLIGVKPDKPPTDIAPPTTAPTSDLAEYIEGEVNDLWDEMATKSQHFLSTSAPTSADPNNPGDVWEQYQEVSVEADGVTPVSPPQKRIIGRWRGQGGVGSPAAPPFAWVPMNLDATFIPLLDIGSGTFGDLHGERLIAGTIGVGKLIVSDFRNLITDPRFELGDWLNPSSGAAATFYTTTTGATVPPTMSNPIRVARWYTTSGDNRIAQLTPMAVTPGERLDVRMWAWALSGASTGTVILQADFRDIDNVNVGYASASSPATGILSWTEVSAEAVVPAGAATVQVVIINQNVNANVMVTNPRVRRKNGGELIVDGAISALLIRGDDFQTHDDGPAPWTTGRGVKWNKDGIYGYPDTGAASPRFFLDAETGLVSATGGLTTGSGQNDVTIYRGADASNPSGIEWLPSNSAVNTSTRADRPSITSWSTGEGSRWGYVPPSEVTGSLQIRGAKMIGHSEQPRIDLDTIRYDGLTPPSSRFVDTEVNVVAHALNFRDLATSGRTPDVGIDVGGVRVNDSAARFTTGGFSGGGLTGASIDNDGALVRTSSSEAVKENIEPLQLAEARKALDLEAVTFTWTDEKKMGSRTHPGFIAEQAHAAGAHLWVTYEGDNETEGAPAGFRYAELTAAHNVLIRDLVARIEELEARVNQLEGNA